MFPAFLGLIELIFLGVFFLLLILGTAFDRQGREEPKWYIFGVGLIAICVWFWNDWTFAGALETVTSWSFWAPVGAYLLAGLVYSLLEFFLDVRRSARYFADAWKKFLSMTKEVPALHEDGTPKTENVKGHFGKLEERVVTRMRPNSELYADVREKGAESKSYDKALEMSADFVRGHNYRNRIIEVGVVEDGVDVEPRVNRVQLAEHIGAWTFFWPAYAISLIVGDLLTEVFRVLADLLTNISGRFVKLSFSDVFKF